MDGADRAAKEISTDDDLVTVLKTHLLLEHEITGAVEGFVNRPKEMEIDRLSFSVKVQIAAGLGIISPELKPCILLINRIRNRFVHRLDAKLEDRDAQELSKALPAYLARHLDSSLNRARELLPAEESGVPNKVIFSIVTSLVLGFMSAQRTIYVELRHKLPPQDYAFMQYILTIPKKDPARVVQDGV